MASLVIISLSNVTLADVYKWVDQDGVEHFGNKPPHNSDATQIIDQTPDESASGETDPYQAVLDEIDQAFEAGDFGKALILLTPLAESGHPRA